MRHLGDITKLKGETLPPVDVITGGSPCQDLSTAGKRRGLDGERSGLFLEQIRVIKEMRNATELIRPRYMVWENVPGAFSSNGGGDFKRVLEEVVRISNPSAPDLPIPKGGWSYAGTIMGDGYSVAWRTHDAQFWGVPQRRRRIALVADFRGDTAAEILFEREGLSGNPKSSGETREETSCGIGKSSEKSVYCIIATAIDHTEKSGAGGTGCKENIAYTLTATDRHAVAVLDNNGADARLKVNDDGIVQTLTARMGTGGNNGPLLCINDQGGQRIDITEEKTGTLRAAANGHQPLIYAQTGFGQFSETEFAMTLRASGGAYGGGSENIVGVSGKIRRLTPLECERLQGYPDGWTNIKGASDTARYKALGNSIALPFWEWMAKRMARIGGIKTMASLFDGIGGFPLVFQRAGVYPVWASEIEPFPIAVTKERFK